MTKKSKTAKKLSKNPPPKFPGPLPMVQVRMGNHGPTTKSAAQLDAEIAEALRPPKRTVTILTITERSREGGTPPHVQVIVFARRERALDAIADQMTDPNAHATIDIRTLDVIQ